jgi:hypothetical protein
MFLGMEIVNRREREEEGYIQEKKRKENEDVERRFLMEESMQEFKQKRIEGEYEIPSLNGKIHTIYKSKRFPGYTVPMMAVDNPDLHLYEDIAYSTLLFYNDQMINSRICLELPVDIEYCVTLII